jgi:hypothetical protein
VKPETKYPVPVQKTFLAFILPVNINTFLSGSSLKTEVFRDASCMFTTNKQEGGAEK